VSGKVARHAVLAVSLVVALAAASAVLAASIGERAVALGIACGSGIALLCGVSWIVGALLTFDAPMNRFLRATLGLGPVRMLVAVGGVCSIAVWGRASIDLVALGCAFASAHFLLQVAEAVIFMQLAAASSQNREARPIRFGGIRLF
jgi:hypothetical protein